MPSGVNDIIFVHLGTILILVLDFTQVCLVELGRRIFSVYV
jgi:hypothetical protein